jgi:antitoxin component HigA of HigAB toxin-antitoxin module
MEMKNMITKVARNLGKIVDSYLRLVRRFPLRAIRAESEYDAAIAVLIPLTGREGGLDQGELEYLRALAVLVGEYERVRYAVKAKTLDPVDLLKFLMRENALSVNDVGGIIGSQPAASMILGGRREISKEAAKKLAGRFGLGVGAFIG